MLYEDDAELLVCKLRVGLELVHRSESFCAARNAHDTSDCDFQAQKAVLTIQCYEPLFAGESDEAHVCHWHSISIRNIANNFGEGLEADIFKAGVDIHDET